MSIRDIINIDFFLNLKPLFRLENVIPTYEADNLTEIQDLLVSTDADAVILDIDQTIVPFGETEISDEIRNFLNSITTGLNFCLLSNVPRVEKRIARIHSIEKQIGIEAVFAEKRKPSPVAFHAALNFLKSKPSRTIMVGDRVFTDILGANSTGIDTILIPPLNPKTDPFFMVKLPRYFERFYLRLVRCLLKFKRR